MRARATPSAAALRAVRLDQRIITPAATKKRLARNARDRHLASRMSPAKYEAHLTRRAARRIAARAEKKS